MAGKTVSRFSALAIGCLLSRSWHRLTVFPRLKPVVRVPAFGVGYMFSRTWHRLIYFPAGACRRHVFASISDWQVLVLRLSLGKHAVGLSDQQIKEFEILYGTIQRNFVLFFQIRNKGPSAVDGSVVTVTFPALFQSSKPKSYLLYLLVVEVSKKKFLDEAILGHALLCNTMLCHTF